jgi:hypothetical protein
MPIVVYDSCDVLIKIIFSFRCNQTHAIFNRKNNMNMNLCIGICHAEDGFV